MNIEFIIQQIRNTIFRPISSNLLGAITKYVEKEIASSEDNKKVYDTINAMSLDDFVKIALDALFMFNKKYDSFLIACICCRIGKIESSSTLPIVQVSKLKWNHYLNLSRDSSVDQYSLNNSFIAVLFYTGPKVYVYSYAKTGFLGTEYMKMCAIQGDGLGRCTSTYFRDHNGFTVIV